MTFEGEARALGALTAYGVEFVVTRHGPVGSLAEAAALRGVSPATSSRPSSCDAARATTLFVLVPGDREFSWPKLRASSASTG